MVAETSFSDNWYKSEITGPDFPGVVDEAFDYIKEDWVNEITQGLNVSEDTLGIHTTCQNCGSSTNL